MATIADAADWLAELAPLELAEEWDNVGLLVGDPADPLERLMTCLTITPGVVVEAVRRRANLIVTHHPLPFRPLRTITTASVEGAMLWKLAGAGVAVYSAHTAFDSAATGVNQQLAEDLGLTGVRPFAETDRADGAGVGRVGESPAGATAASVAERLKAQLGLASIRVVAGADRSIERVAVACGSGGSLLDAAMAAGCDAVVTGEASFHDCLKCEALGVALLLVGHYHSERFAMERLAERAGGALDGVEAWASESESDPIRTV